MNHIYLILSFITGALVFSLVRKIILSIIKKKVNPPSLITNASVGKVYRKDGKEAFQWKKFWKIFDLGDLTEWIKSIKEIIDLRKLIIYGLIAGTIFAYGWYRGKGDTPIQMNLSYDKEFVLDLNGEYLHKPKYSNDVYIKEDKTGKVLKHIKAKDFPQLAKRLKPIGFIFEPIGVMGYGVGKDVGYEAGAGVSWLKYWKWKADTFLTNKGIYLGTSYQLTDNSGLGLAGGKGYKGDTRVLFYYKWKF